MTPNFGATRSDIRSRHALLTPESHEWIIQPGWEGAEFSCLISPDMGAKFAMFLLRFPADCMAPPALPGVARFLLCLEGEFQLDASTTLNTGDFAFLPPEDTAALRITQGSRLVLFEWCFLASGPVPAALHGSVDAVTGQPLRGNDWLIVQKLLPTDPAFDAEFNVMTFHPGASLAYVETHFMEHGLLFLDGGGVYRLDDRWYPVEAGDAIWMGPHVPQWFGALGRTPARYLIYKNYNRSPLARR
ncbi:(S)-ureidoglycine aminohydrolase [Paracoccus pantotrophus]|uniref:(S)-ureidoglycine aminohydrolase n=2 Tax=Paracoccaceae TaxID=31989 RepID=A0AAE6NX89_PARPN|nr:(S)-ureidoglycine aminohydrolase [Paracoccus pantotrophus]QFG37583.1 cupin domain-containing protein [Paracoccus pantotrophus]RKS51959.1 (S)-ureidoglycine aminohydrolase [Paracoccus pantotrophus]